MDFECNLGVLWDKNSLKMAKIRQNDPNMGPKAAKMVAMWDEKWF